MKRNELGLIFVRMILLVSIVVVAGCAARYAKQRHADEMTNQKKEEVQQPKVKVVKRNVKRLQLDKNGVVKKEQENPTVEPSEEVICREENSFYIIEMDNEFGGLPNDDFISYLILENEIRLNLTLHAEKLSDEKAVEAIDVFIEWLEGLKDTENFSDFSLYDRIDELIENQIENKAHLDLWHYWGDKKEWQEMLTYFQNCREKGETFQDATNNCRDTLTKSAPELG